MKYLHGTRSLRFIFLFKKEQMRYLFLGEGGYRTETKKQPINRPTKTRLLALVALDQSDGALVDLSRSDEPINGADGHDADEHDDTPVEAQNIGRRSLRPEAPEEGKGRVEEGEGVDGDAPPAERPAAVWQELRVVDAAVEDAADGRHVGDHEGDEVERDDGVEGGVGADVDEGEQDGEHAGHGDRVDGDLELGVHGGDPVAVGEAVVAGKGPRLARRRQVVGEGAGVDEDDDNGREHVEGGRAEGLREDVHVGVARSVVGVVDGALDVDDAEEVGDEEDEAERAVQHVRPHHCLWHGAAGVLDLLRHVRCGVGADAGVDGGDLADHQGNTSCAPAARVGEDGKDGFGRVARCQHPDADNDCEEAKHVQDQHDVLEDGHGSGAPDVGDPDEAGDGDDEESSLPVGVGVALVCLPDHGLDKSTDQIRTRCGTGLPRQSGHPTGKVTHNPLLRRWCEFRDPVVLASGSRGHRGHLC